MAQRALAVATTAKGGGFWGQSNQAWWPLVTTDHLSSLPPQAQAFAQQVSGLVAMKINGERVCWWRPQLIQQVESAGNPFMPGALPGDMSQLSPRRSLQKWAEAKHQRSDRWRNKHRMAAKKVSKLLMDWPWLR